MRLPRSRASRVAADADTLDRLAFDVRGDGNHMEAARLFRAAADLHGEAAALYGRRATRWLQVAVAFGLLAVLIGVGSLVLS